MAHRLPARHSATGNFSVVRKKANSSYRRGSGRTVRRSSGLSPKANRSKLNLGVRVLVGGTIVGIIIAVALYIGFQTMVQQALTTGMQTVLFVPKTVEDAPAEVWVIKLDRDIADSTIIAIPANSQVELPGGYGKYRLGAVYPLLDLENKDYQFIRASYSRSLGVLVDTVVPLTAYGRDSAELKTLILHSVWKWVWHRDTDSLVILKAWLFLKRNPVPLQANSVEVLQQQVAGFEASREAAQGCPVGILNGSETAGAAGSLSRLLEAGKIITIRVGTFPQDVSQTEIYHDGRAECLPVLERVSSSLLHKPLVELDKQMTTQYRSAIVIVLGKDLQ